MTSLYTPSDGINQRRGKSKSPTQASFFPNSGDTDDSKVGWESTALRIKYRERSAVFILAIVLSLVGFRYFLGATRDMTGDKSSLRSVEGYRWKNYPRVVFLAGERDRNPVQGNSQLPPLSWYAEPLAKARFFKHLQDSSSYDEGKSDAFETKTCKPQYPWQTRSFPSCNLLHEESMASHVARSSNELRRVGNGYWRDVWALPSSRFEKKLVLKTIRYEHQYLERNYDRHRRDALAMERLTQNPFVVDIYAYCGNSGVFEFADGGDIAEALWPHDPVTRRRTYGVTSRLQRLHIGAQAAMGLAAVHNVDKEGRASIAHTDISPAQFVRVGDKYKLNDFNRARFLRWNISSESLCTFSIASNPGKNRSPEEYNFLPETEKIDVYSLGNVFYMLLMQDWPFKGLPVETAQAKIKAGLRPDFYADVWNSTNPIDETLKTAMLMCHEQDVEKRATARQVESFLTQKLVEIDPGRLESWTTPEGK